MKNMKTKDLKAVREAVERMDEGFDRDLLREFVKRIAPHRNCDAAWCPECRAEMAKCDADFCCVGDGASLIPLFGDAEQRKFTADAIANELDAREDHAR